MKIGILTFHWAQNYGAVLQCYALKCKLEELGHDVFMIDRIPQYQGILRDLYHRFSYKYVLSWWKFSRFNRVFLQPKTRTYRTQEALDKFFPQEKLDAIVVGSDQVWRWGILGYNYFLDFASRKQFRKFSYAASFGLSHWTDNGLSTAQVTRLLKEFDAVSVREQTGVNICRRIFDVNASLVLDPTLLYDADFYEQKILKGYEKKTDGRLVSYILGKENLEQCHQIARWAKEQGLAYKELYWTGWEIPSLNEHLNGFFHISVPEWLNAIRNAEYVLTNSFHCAVFAILFRKKFMVLNNPSGGLDRILTLLGLLRLKQRYLSDLIQSDGLLERLENPIDYERVQKDLEACRKDSLAFLVNIR